MNFFVYLPTVVISKIVGALVVLPAPHFIWQLVIRIYCSFYKVDLSEIELPLKEYKNLGEFFVRNLKVGSRPIAPGVVSPVDGLLRNCGEIGEEKLPQIKGREYSLYDLIGEEQTAQSLVGGTFFNLYLSPRDYHHVHSPIAGNIKKIIYIPGRLLPVNDHSMSTVDNLFGTNERVSIVIEALGKKDIVLTMVGALNVGKISLTFDNQLSQRISASPWPQQGFIHDYGDTKIFISAGDRLGTFHMGSSVALLFPMGVFSQQMRSAESRPIKMGENL